MGCTCAVGTGTCAFCRNQMFEQKPPVFTVQATYTDGSASSATGDLEFVLMNLNHITSRMDTIKEVTLFRE